MVRAAFPRQMVPPGNGVCACGGKEGAVREIAQGAYLMFCILKNDTPVYRSPLPDPQGRVAYFPVTRRTAHWESTQRQVMYLNVRTSPRQFPARTSQILTTPSQPQETHAAVSGRKARQRTVVVRVSHVATRPPSASSQMRRLGSFPARARYIPSGLTARALTDSMSAFWIDLTSVPSFWEKMRTLPSAVPGNYPPVPTFPTEKGVGKGGYCTGGARGAGGVPRGNAPECHGAISSAGVARILPCPGDRHRQ